MSPWFGETGTDIEELADARIENEATHHASLERPAQPDSNPGPPDTAERRSLPLGRIPVDTELVGATGHVIIDPLVISIRRR